MSDPRSTPKKDQQTVEPDGTPVGRRIHGVHVRYALTIPDERGTICEVYRPSWGVHPDPLVYAYQVTIRPGHTKGWVLHQKQDDRSFLSQGALQLVLYDARKDSPTHGLVNELCFSEHNRALFTIPCGVWHALRNIGDKDVLFINMPTRAYEHADPDKLRLPLENDVIPYRWR